MDPEAQPEQTFPAVDMETVLITVPADPDYLGVIRSAGAHVATKAGCTLQEVADLRLAVDEACGLLLRNAVRDPDAGGSADLECRFDLEPATLRVVLGLRARDVIRPDEDDFGWSILSALVDRIVWRMEGAVAQVEILKHHAAGR